MRRFLLTSIVLLLIAALALFLAARGVLGSDLVRAAIERQLADRTGQPVRIARATASVYPRVAVRLENVSIGEPAAIELASIRLVTGLRALWSRTVEDAEVVVSGGRILLPLPFPLVEPPDPGAPAAAGGGGLSVRSVRVLSFDDVELHGGGRSLQVDLESSLQGDRLDVSRLSARAERTAIEATGTFSSIARLEGRFTATANPLDLAEMIGLASAFAAGREAAPPSRAAGGTVPFNLVIAAAAPSGSYGAYRFSNLSANAQVSPGRVALSDLAVQAFGGSFAGRLDVNTETTTPALQLNGRLENMDVPQLMAAAGSPGGVTGKLAAALNLAGRGADAAALTRSSRGTISAAVRDGAIPGLDMVRQIVLAFGKPSGAPPAGSGSAFSRLGGAFSLANSTLTSSDLAMTSRDFDMAGSGSLRLDTGALGARADVVLSRELTAQAGTDLRRYAQQDGRIVVPATIGGTLQQPKVSLDIAAAAGRALGNELKRRATSILDRLLKRKEE